MIQSLKKSRKVQISLIVLILLILSITGYGIYRQYSPVVIRAGGDYFIPEDVNDLEANSEIIVKVKVSNKSKEYIEYDEEGAPLYGHTLTDVKIQEILSDSNNIVSEENKIQICEPYFHYKVFGVQNYLITIEDYNPMVSGNEYILYLKSAKSIGPNVYYVVGNEYGNYAISKDESMLNSNSKYKKLYDEVIRKSYKDK